MALVANNSVYSVCKSDGSLEEFNIEKIHNKLKEICKDITGVSISDIEMNAKLNFYNGITTKEIREAITKAAADLISEDSPNYQYVAGKLLNYDIRKIAWGGNNPPKLYDHIINMVKKGFYIEDLLFMYSESEWNKINSFMDHNKDMSMEFIAIKEYLTKYAVRDRSLKEVLPLETPQLTYILIAAILMYETKQKNLKNIKEYYELISNGKITQPTPIMAGIRTNTKQGSSCILLAADDTLNSIISVSEAIIKYISKKAGIGIDVSRIRTEGSVVGKEKGIKHTGLIPYLKFFESAVLSCSQGGIRGGAATIYFQFWRLDIEELLVLKNNKGSPDTRVRNLDYAIQVNSYLYKRCIQNKNVTLFCPKDVKDMYNAYFSDQNLFAKLYEKYENDITIRKKVINGRELLSKLLIERKETGRIYLFNIDNANEHSSFTVPVTQSNLCLEVILPTIPMSSIEEEIIEISDNKLLETINGFKNDSSIIKYEILE